MEVEHLIVFLVREVQADLILMLLLPVVNVLEMESSAKFRVVMTAMETVKHAVDLVIVNALHVKMRL
jgi:hypothetical protein